MENDRITCKPIDSPGARHPGPASGDLASAHRHYLEAARLLLTEAKQIASPTLRAQRVAYANQIMAQANALSAQLQHPHPVAPPKPAAQTLAGDDATPDWLLAERPRVRLADVAGLDDVKEQIALKIIYPFTHPDAAQRFGVKPGGGILLYGPPGTGKTFIPRRGRRTGCRLFCGQGIRSDEPVVWQSRAECGRALCRSARGTQIGDLLG